MSTIHDRDADGPRESSPEARYPGRAGRWFGSDSPIRAALGRTWHRLVDAWRAARPHVIAESRGLIDMLTHRWWFRMSRRRQHALVVICGLMLAVGIGLSIHESEPDERGEDVPSPVALGVPSRVEMAKPPVLVPVSTSSVRKVAALTPGQRRGIARKAAAGILSALDEDEPRVAVLRLLDLPLSYAALTPADRKQLATTLGGDAARRYEVAVAELLDDLIDAVERRRPDVILTVQGLPVEPEEAGVNLDAVQRTNERYEDVLERMGPFVPSRRFVVFGSSLDERMLAKMGMREALRLRHGRPIIFQTNLVWRALVDEAPDGQPYELEALLLDE